MRIATRIVTAAVATMAAVFLAAPAQASPAAVTSPADANHASAEGFLIPAALPETAPVDVNGKQIVDEAGVGADTSEAQQALSDLQKDQSVRMYVVIVDSFDGMTKNEWAEQSFTKSDLGGRNILWAISTGDRVFGGHAGTSLPISRDTLNAVFNGEPSTKLTAGDYSGAIVAATAGLEKALGETGAPGTSSSDSGSLAWLWVVLIVAAGVIVYLWYRSWKRKKAAEAEAKKNAGPPPEPYEELSNRSINALIQTDNAVQASESELQIAEAEFGTDAAADFRGAHNAAKQYLTKAFQLRQEIDDEIPESEEIRRGWMQQILDLCKQAQDGLDSQTEKFERLRNLKARLPEVLGALPGKIDEQNERLPAAAATVQRLTGVYSEEALATVDGNTDQAHDRLDFAREALATATKAAGVADGGDSGSDTSGSDTTGTSSGTSETNGGETNGGETNEGDAVIAARAAQEAVKQATHLLDAIDRLESDLAASAAQLSTAKSHVTEELSEVRDALAHASAGGRADRIRQRLDSVQQTLTEVSTGSAGRNPVASLKRLNDADLELDEILADTQTAQKQEQRARAMLDNELSTARSTVSAVDDFISSRRGAMADTSRTRLAEAKRFLQQAQDQSDTDAKAALVSAQRATDLARQAYQEARNDMDRWGGGGYGGRRMGGMGGGLLGGIMIGSLLGGGFGGGWGGGGGMGGGFGGGGMGGGGFGGGFGGGGGGFGGGF